MALDPLAERLEHLLADGSIIASDLSRSMRARLGHLFDLSVLVEEKSGGGRRVVVRDRSALEVWIDSTYPSGLAGVAVGFPARAESVANFANSKRGRPLAQRPVLVRGFGSAVLRRGTESMPIGDLTRQYSVAAALVDCEAPWQFDGMVALVENFELFLHVERVVGGLNAALWYRGRVDAALLLWLSTMPSARVVQVADFDPVGIDEYLRTRAVLGDRATLFVPDDLMSLTARFGNSELLARSVAVLSRVRNSSDPAVQSVIAVLDKCGKGLEQEGLLLRPSGT